MLRHIELKYVTHGDYFHLGDVINVVQQLHNRSLKEQRFYRMFSHKDCPCCGVQTGAMIKDIISLLETKIMFSKQRSKKYEVCLPSWIKGRWDGLTYAKAKNLPSREQHVVCQFDKRSHGNKVPDHDKLLKMIAPEMTNIGDSELPCVDFRRVSLLEKFNLIASASLYIGVDSGLTHLALLTETPIVCVHPPTWNARRYYPEAKQIKFQIV
jgi:hypothetical protein